MAGSSCDEAVLAFAGLCHSGYSCSFRMRQSAWSSAKALRNRENVRKGTFVRECSQRKRSRKTFARERSQRVTGERTFVRKRSQRATEYRTFVRGDLQGHRKERHFVRLDS